MRMQKVLNMDMEKSNEALKVLKGYNPYSEFDMEYISKLLIWLFCAES